MVKIVGDAREAIGARVPTFEDKDRAEAIVRKVVHAGDEDSAVRREGKKADTVKTASGDMDIEGVRQVQGNGFPRPVIQIAWCLGKRHRRNERGDNRKSGAEKTGTAHV